MLSAGDYFFSVSTDQPPLVTVRQKDGTLIAVFAAQSAEPSSLSGPTRIFAANDGTENYVTFIYVRERGLLLTFAPPSQKPGGTDVQVAPAPSSQAGQEAEEKPSGWFTIHNPRRQNLSYTEVEAIYLSACKVVQEEFNLVEPVRPHLTLILDADKNNVFYPKREIQLTKWDKYRFAQGVVLLAMDSLLPIDKRLSLTRLAVLKAEGTVDVSKLKASQPLEPGAPHN